MCTMINTAEKHKKLTLTVLVISAFEVWILYFNISSIYFSELICVASILIRSIIGMHIHPNIKWHPSPANSL